MIQHTTNGDTLDHAIMLQQALREKKIRAARENLRDFIEYCMPDPDHYDDYLMSRYDCHPHHQLLIDMFMEISAGDLLRGAVSIPPQHGKTTVFAHYGLAWHAGRNTEKKIIYGTYSEPRAGIVGAAVRNIMDSDRFRDVFPDFEIRKGESSKFQIGYGREGSMMFVGRGSGASGNPCDLFVIDDPYKSRMEARSKQVRAIVWDWYCSVVEARCPAATPVAIIHTRWNDDDLIGRLCDPEHPEFSAEDNDEFRYMNVPAILDRSFLLSNPELSEKLGLSSLQPGEERALWPTEKYRNGKEEKTRDKWPLSLLYKIRRKNPQSFSAVFMGQPIPPDGDFYKMNMINGYQPGQLPSHLRNYGASDHAVSTTRRADKTVIGCAGVDAHGHLWIYADLFWDKVETPTQVDEIAKKIKKHRPFRWWAEGDHIKKAIGPFLKKMLKKHRLFSTTLVELPKAGDKLIKSESILAMAQMGMLHLPAFAPWYKDAVSQMLRFDGSEGRPDDFCDFLANLGRGLDEMMDASTPAEPEPDDIPVTGTAAWVKMAARNEARRLKRLKSLAGW